MTQANSNPTVIDVAYAAGFFDGEGSIVMNFQTSQRGSRSYKVHTSVMNTDRPILDWLQSQFGGAIYNHGFKKKPANWRAGWQWHINGNADVEVFLTALRPYLRIKGPLADNALRFVALKRKVGAGRKTPPDLQAQFTEMHAIHHALITRGRVDPVIVPLAVKPPQMEMLNG